MTSGAVSGALRAEVEGLLASPENPLHGEHGRTARRLVAVVLEGL